MKRPTALLAVALAAASLTGCMDGRYGHGGYIGWRDYPYHGWYDDYYGPIYDGYWGLDGLFYFRLDGRDARYRRDDHQHFRRDDARPDSRFHRFEGMTREPPRGTRMPNFPRDQRR